MSDRQLIADLLSALEYHTEQTRPIEFSRVAIEAAREYLRKPAQQEPVSIKSVAQKAGINLQETYIPTMDDAIAAGDSVLMNEQAALLRECRAALDSLIAQKPTLAGLLCGSTTLGNLKAELGAYRPQGVFGTSPQRKPWVGLTWDDMPDSSCDDPAFLAGAQWANSKLKEKNT